MFNKRVSAIGPLGRASMNMKPRPSGFSALAQQQPQQQQQTTNVAAPAVPAPTSTTTAATAALTLPYEVSDRHTLEPVSSLPQPLYQFLMADVRSPLRQTLSSRIDTATGVGICVLGNRCFIWKTVSPKQARSFGASYQAFQELPLPAENLTADHVALTPSQVLLGASPTQLAALACSPSGTLRYWQNCFDQGSHFHDSQLKTAGYSALRVIAADYAGFLVITSGPQILQIFVTGDAFVQAQIDLDQLSTNTSTNYAQQPPKSSLFSKLWLFSSTPSAEPQQIQMCSACLLPNPHPANQPSELVALTKAGQLLRVSISARGEENKLICNIPLNSQIKARIAETLPPDQSEISLFFVDLCFAQRAAYVLVASPVSTSIQYYIVEVRFSETSANIAALNRVPYSPNVSEFSEYQLFFSPRIFASQKGGALFLLAQSTVISIHSVSLSNSLISNKGPDDQIIGGGIIGDKAHFISQKFGVFSVYLSDQTPAIGEQQAALQTAPQPVAQPAPTVVLSLDGRTVQEQTDHLLSLLKDFTSAGCKFTPAIMALYNPLVSLASDRLALIVSSANLTIVNSRPVADPSWAEQRQSGLKAPTGATVLLRRHLDSKLAKATAFQKLLAGPASKTSILSKVDEQTKDEVSCQVDKLNAAVTLRALHCDLEDQQEDGVLDIFSKAIAASLASREKELQGASPVDLFYSEVTRIDDIFPRLVELLRKKASLSDSVAALQQRFLEISFVDRALLALLQAMKPRSVWLFSQPVIACTQAQVITHLLPLVSDLRKGPKIKEFSVPAALAALSNEAEMLLDSVLAIIQFEIAPTEEAVEFRRSALQAMVQNEMFTHVRRLAEKFKDFEALIAICEKTSSVEDLQGYIDRFLADGFPTILFEHWYKTGQEKALLSQDESRDSMVTLFLNDKPHLAWINHLKRRRFMQAAQILIALASEEPNLEKRKELASLCKLAEKASTDSFSSDLAQRSSDLLFLISHQEGLIDGKDRPAMTTPELADAYVQKAKETGNIEDWLAAVEISYKAESNEENEEIGQRVVRELLGITDWDTELSSVTGEKATERVLEETMFVQVMKALNEAGGYADMPERIVEPVFAEFQPPVPVALRDIFSHIFQQGGSTSVPMEDDDQQVD